MSIGGNSAAPEAEAPADGAGQPRVADLLEILIFTYDRADRLRRTLEALEASPFGRCRITVLDNCSPDDTPEVCHEFLDRLPALRTIRHPRNIGLGANYLRAIEVSRARYSWILSDDETLTFDHCQDVIDAIEAGEVDMISLGSPGQQDWERGVRATTQELLARGQRFFFVWTFAAGLIFKTEHFDDRCVQAGYGHLHGDYAHFPHFEFIYQCLRRNLRTYISQYVCVARPHEAVRTSGTPLSWFLDIARTTANISEQEWRVEAVYEAAADRSGWERGLAKSILVERIDHPDALWTDILQLLVELPAPQRHRLVTLLPLTLIPRTPLLLAARFMGRMRSVRGARRGG